MCGLIVEKIKQLVRSWPAHVVTAVVSVLVLAVLSIPDLSATAGAALGRTVDLAQRVSNALLGAVVGYWVSRWFLQELYAARKAGGLSATALIWFEAIRALFVFGGMLAISLSVRP